MPPPDEVEIYLGHLDAETADTLWLDGPQCEPVPSTTGPVDLPSVAATGV